jgi:hypothetical protein
MVMVLTNDRYSLIKKTKNKYIVLVINILDMKQLSLKHFIVRSQVLALYRDIMRTVMKINDEDYRKESL